MRNHLNRFRAVAIAEGISFIALLGIAMPLKYAMDMPMAVRVVGWVHGALFLLYLLAGHLAAREQRWTLTFRVWAIGASLLPFAAFVLEHQLRTADRKGNPDRT